jgi:hypothetical protein
MKKTGKTGKKNFEKRSGEIMAKKKGKKKGKGKQK